MPERSQNIVFLCTGNSCRSQMAEGFARAMHGDRYEVHSAGTQPHGMNPLAIRAMAEAGVNITSQWSKSIADLGNRTFDIAITVCDSAREACPTFPGALRMMHAGFDDPPRLAADAADEEEAMQHYRRVRDEIRAFIEQLPERLNAEQSEP